MKPSVTRLNPPLLHTGAPVPSHSPDYERTLTLQFQGIDPVFLAALRSSVISRTSSLAISYVWVQYNSTLMISDQLSHVLGLVDLHVSDREFETMQPRPSNFEPDHLQKGDWVDKEFLTKQFQKNSKSIVRFLLDVECYIDANGKIVNPNVLASHLKPCMEDPYCPRSVYPVYPNQVIAHLAPGQRVVLEAWACVDLGSKHARFKPVSVCHFQLKNDVTLEVQEGAQEACASMDIEDVVNAIVDVCPQKVFERKNLRASASANEARKKDKSAAINEEDLNRYLAVARPLKCNSCGDCYSQSTVTQNLIRISGREDNLAYFFLESKGKVSTKHTILSAIRAIRKSLMSLDPSSTLYDESETEME